MHVAKPHASMRQKLSAIEAIHQHHQHQPIIQRMCVV